MISEKTVYVLGAGASASYNFPVAKDLTQEIVSILTSKPLDDAHPIFPAQSVSKTNIGPDYAEEFAQRLELSGLESIDNFLEKNGEKVGYTELGKAAIASVLLPYEKTTYKTYLKPKDGDNWFDYLWQHMVSDIKNPEDILDNKISFVTFNYDRSLEYAFDLRLRHAFPGVNYKKSIDIIKNIPIVHVYGSLGSYSHPDDSFHPGKESLPFGMELYRESIIEAMHSINLIGDERDNLLLFDKAHEIIRNSKVRCFLGFGYDKTNLERLLPTTIEQTNWKGSAYKLSPMEKKRIKRLLKDFEIEFGSRADKCLRFLKENDVINAPS